MKVIFFIIIMFVCNCKNVFSLYEDQIGKFDWKKNLIGTVKYSLFAKDVNQQTVIFAATEENVVACLCYKSGNILWRKILEKGNLGRINALHLYNKIIFAVSGTDVILIRGWDIKYGYLISQWSFQLHPNEVFQKILWFCSADKLYKLFFLPEQSPELETFKISNGEKLSQKNIFSLEPVYTIDRCAVNNGILLCLNEVGFATMNFTNENFIFHHVNFNYTIDKQYFVNAHTNTKIAVFTIYDGIEKFSVCIDKNLEFYKSNAISEIGDVNIITLSSGIHVTITVMPISQNILELKGLEQHNERTLFLRRFVLKFPVGQVTISAIDCVEKVADQIICSILVTTTDGSVILLKSTGELKWMREEALANVVTGEIIELPMSDTEAEMQTEFDAKESDVMKMFIRRISSHIFQLQKLFLGILGMLEKSFSTDLDNGSKLVRDYFNLHKIILVITKQLKVYAIDNVSKDILWSYLIKYDFEPFPASSTNEIVRIPLFIQRTYRHYPHPMQCTILVKDKRTKNGVIISFDPVTGKFESELKLDFKIKQAMLLPKQTINDYLQGIMILKEDNSIYVYPEYAKTVMLDITPNLYVHVAEADICQVNGYMFNYKVNNTVLIPAWNMKCTGKIIKVCGKNPIEKVHSQGRVLSDRSVLYKYLNPNLIVVVSQSFNPEDQKSMLTLYFVDSVTGVIVNGDVRYKASDPVHLIHSENWVVLIYYNDKARRTEVVTYELYEGKTQKNSTVFSSVETKSLRPIVDSRVYVLPTSYVEAARETITEKGITSKHVLVALSVGNIVELPWVILDPRRPFSSTNEIKEEGVLPYIPEIPIPTETIINYNQTLNRVRGILTSPTGLESTSFVFVYGLDLFYTRTAPSKTFDLLKEDFDYVLIIVVLVLLIMLTFISKHLAYRRALRQAWR